MNQLHPLTLFIIKRCYGYDGGQKCISNGLKLSAQFVVDMLLHEGYRAKLVEAVDGNSIDALVSQNSPVRVVIEAIWVTPAKVAELQKKYPKIKWTVRIHSETPFLAQEGMAVTWIAAYMKQGVEVSFNSPNAVNDFSVIGKSTYLPNYYPLRKPRSRRHPSVRLDVGCFGAIRPLKNQLIQALASIQYAKKVGMNLMFHMNGSRVEQSGSNNLKNIQAAFDAAGPLYKLVLHDWMAHDEFLELIAKMDVCLQVSLTESFNIVSADAVSIGVPLIGSPAIRWLPSRSKATVDSAADIAKAMGRADQAMVMMNHEALTSYLAAAVETWVDWVAN